MEELLFFPTWMLILIPQVISVMKLWVPTLWREVLSAVIAAVATAYVIVTTDLTLAAGIGEGVILFLILTGTRAAVNAMVNPVKAVKQQVPILASKEVVQNMGIFIALLVSSIFVAKVLAQDSTLVAPVVETAKATGRLWVLLGAQFAARLIDWIFTKKLS
jgi:uncharacterized protein YacL